MTPTRNDVRAHGLHAGSPRTAADVEVLFKEAHRRRRRRRLTAAAAVVVVAAIVAAAVLVRGGEKPKPRPVSSAKAAPKAVANPLPPPTVAWVDYQGRVHVGSLQSHQQRVVASSSASAVGTLVASGKTLFWAGQGGIVYDKATRQLRSLSRGVMAYDIVTGRARPFASGGLVFNAVNSSDVFVNSYDERRLARYGLDGVMRAHFTLPTGWSLAYPYGVGAASPALAQDRFLVQSGMRSLAKTPAAQSSKLGVWTPANGAVQVLGEISSMVATYTDDRGTDSRIAWLPPSCEELKDCRLQLADLASGVTTQISNPLGFGFDERGAFSPNGRELAAFAKTNSGLYDPETRLALIDVPTGSLRLITGTTIGIGEPLAWAQWLPRSATLIVGGNSDNGGLAQANHFIVDSRTGRSTPFRFLTDGMQDVNYSVVALP